jgi:hypothetical protein
LFASSELTSGPSGIEPNQTVEIFKRNMVADDERKVEKQSHLILPSIPRSIFVYFRGLFYDVGYDPEGGYYAKGARTAVWETFKDIHLFDISTKHPTKYHEYMQKAAFCLCPFKTVVEFLTMVWDPGIRMGLVFPSTNPELSALRETRFQPKSMAPNKLVHTLGQAPHPSHTRLEDKSFFRAGSSDTYPGSLEQLELLFGSTHLVKVKRTINERL